MFSNAEILNETDKLRKFAFKLTANRHDAEDLLQSTILRSLEKKHLFKKDSNLYGWTSKIMYNLFVSGYRRRTKFETQYDPENYIENLSVEPSQPVQMDLREVGEAIDLLSEDHREILIMVCIKGMRYAEVSEILDIPVGTVRSRLSRARESLAAILGRPQAERSKNIVSGVPLRHHADGESRYAE